MEVWGGVECSINRVGDHYFDQLSYDDQYNQPALLDHITGLGVSSIRYPILWEKNWPNEDEAPCWEVAQQLALLKENHINVIAGLVHHGSGPLYAPINADCFAEKLAIYAKMVATQFPWITDYTPINEPLTTARFCGLYGLWYPHGTDSKLFLQILINECRATILAMRAIREVNAKARLIFTEDLTKIHGTIELKDQIDFENHRRWLSIDLICGKVIEGHPLWDYLLGAGIEQDQLRFFSDYAMPPAVLGFNYYVTSERYLDHDLEKHPPHSHGGNGKIRYADIEAVRQPSITIKGPANLMREAWHRYHLPMAITEAHLSCGREDQLRWLNSIWNACKSLDQEGIKVIAVTFWSLFGAYGWDRLLTAAKGTYESGAFDLSSGSPRPTAIAKLIKTLAGGQSSDHPLINGLGWWQHSECSPGKSKPILLIGSSGVLGSAFAKICEQRNIPFISLEREAIAIIHPHEIEVAIIKYRPWALINTTEFMDVDVAINLAKISRKHGIQVLSFSSELLSEIEKKTWYFEETEQQILAYNPNALIVRTSSFLGVRDQYNFALHASLDLLIDNECGTWYQGYKESESLEVRKVRESGSPFPSAIMEEEQGIRSKD